MKDRIKRRLKQAAEGHNLGGIYVWIFFRDAAAMLVSAILSTSLAYVLWAGKPDLYYLYKFKIQGGALVWASKWIVFAVMAGSALALFMVVLFFALSSALNLLVLAVNPHVRRLQALAELQRKSPKTL